MSKKTSLSIARPFGPFVGKFKLPQALIDDVNSFIDKNEESPDVIKAVDWSSNLVGKVHQELLIPERIIKTHEDSLKNEVNDYLQQVMSQGVVSLSTNKWNIEKKVKK